MTKSTARVRALRVTVVVCLFAAVIIGPQAFIKAPHFDDFSLVRPLAAQGTANYTYTVIANGTSCSTLGAPVLNNAGEAAFRGDVDLARSFVVVMAAAL